MLSTDHHILINSSQSHTPHYYRDPIPLALPNAVVSGSKFLHPRLNSLLFLTRHQSWPRLQLVASNCKNRAFSVIYPLNVPLQVLLPPLSILLFLLRPHMWVLNCSSTRGTFNCLTKLPTNSAVHSCPVHSFIRKTNLCICGFFLYWWNSTLAGKERKQKRKKQKQNG